jgi:hypothetical protein
MSAEWKTLDTHNFLSIDLSEEEEEEEEEDLDDR